MIQQKSSNTLQASLFLNIWAWLNNSINNIWAADILIKLLLFSHVALQLQRLFLRFT